MKIKRTVLIVLLLDLFSCAVAAEATTKAGSKLGEILPIWSGLPFIGILLSIALFPLFAPHFWHHHFPKVATFWAMIFAIPFVWSHGHPAFYEILHIFLIDYIPFIILLWSLFTITGGILVEGAIVGTPVVNTLLLLISTLIASWTGTTGASMLMIRPTIRANATRKNKALIIIFFIFLVSNIGGALTPLGDPPLFLGFLHGVPFFWTLRILPQMAFMVMCVLGLFFILDTVMYRRDIRSGVLLAHDGKENIRLRIHGAHNLLFLVGIVMGVLSSGLLHLGSITILGVHVEKQNLLRDGFLIFMSILSIKTTSKVIREGNQFSWGPIKEVAYLFAGIFMTIIPVLMILRAGNHGALAFIINSVKQPWHYFWISGGLSSFLDNAPTYLTFMNTALGNFFPGVPEPQAVARLISEKGVYLAAISCGAVFMGANTYIGNAPNFMVRSIAEEQGIRMPSFFGYMAYSIAILIPIFILTTFIFF